MFNLEIFRSKDSLLLLEKEKPEIVRILKQRSKIVNISNNK